MNLNRIIVRYIVSAAVLLLLGIFGTKLGWTVIAVSLLVPFAWLWMFYWRYTRTVRKLYRPAEPDIAVDWVAVALAGCVAWLIAPVFVFFGESLNDVFAAIVNGNPLGYFVLRAGFIEELLKLSAVLVVIGYLCPSAIKHPSDGIVLACAASLGFAAYENIFHNLHLVDLVGWERTKAFLLGSFIRVPLHALYGAIWGAALGTFRILSAPKRYFVLLLSLGASMFLHGLWDTLVQSRSVIAFVLVVLLYSTLWHCYFKLWKTIAVMHIPADS